MSSDDWYRNTDWNIEIEEAFFKKLGRARTQKLQYLRIQAGYLSDTHPEITLKLLEEYFEPAIKDNHFDIAQAYLEQASAFVSLNKILKANNAFKKALQREKEYPNMKTGAWKIYSIFIVRTKQKNKYDEILEVLATHDRLTFPIDRFIYLAIKAIILNEKGDTEIAITFASQAFDETQVKDSGFSYHKKVGLYSDKYEDIYLEISKILKKKAH